MSAIATAGETAELAGYLERPQAPVSPDVAAAIAGGRIDPTLALDRGDLDRLLDPAPLRAETGWCTLPDACGYAAVRTEMPGVSPAMVDWWFDWHPRDPLRYLVWCPRDHGGTGFDPGPADARRAPGAKPFWGTTHFPVEDVGAGMQRLRIEFVRPSEAGFSSDCLDDPRVGTVVAGYPGDPAKRVRHSLMAHVFLNVPGGLVLRSHFWLGAALRPDLPAPLAAPAARLLGRPGVRRRLVDADIPRGLADHCSREYAHLTSILPELHERFGPATDPIRKEPHR